MKRPEQLIQQACVKWFRLQHPNKILFAVNNNAKGGRISDARAGGIAKSMGVLAGVSDLVFCVHGRAHFIEVKAPRGRQNESQKEFKKLADLNELSYHIVYDLYEFIDVIYLLTLQK